MTALIETARSLFDTDDMGRIVNAEDVHPEYQRAVVDIVTRHVLQGGDLESGRAFIRNIIGLPEEVSAPETEPVVEPVGPRVEYLAYREQRVQRDSDKYAMNPHNGNMEKTLAEYADEGWRLVSFDWNSWRTAVFMREVQPVEEFTDPVSDLNPYNVARRRVARRRVMTWLLKSEDIRPDRNLLGSSYEHAPLYRSDIKTLLEASKDES